MKPVRGTVKNKTGVMMWLAITSDGRSRLVTCPDRVNSDSYQKSILTPNLNFIRQRNPSLRDNVVFMQDGAPAHTSASTRAFLTKHRVNLLPEWPPQSPDLNPVEHCWGKIAKALVGRRFPNKLALETAIHEEWAKVPPSYIQTLYGSMVRRLTAVQLAKGGNTRY